MSELFRGYVETKGKKAIEKFKNRSDLKTYNQVEKLNEFAGVLAQDIIMVDIDNYEESEILMDIVEDLQLQCRVYETKRGKHFYFKNTSVESCKTHTKLACGIEADIKIGKKNSYDALKVDGKERVIIFDKDENAEYDLLPSWLLPVKTDIDFENMGEGDGRNQALFNYILTLQKIGLDKDEVRECLRIINRYVLKKPLEDSELEVIMRDEAFIPIEDDGEDSEFFSAKGAFLFDKFAKHLVKICNIIKIDNRLYMYKDGVYVVGYGEIESKMISLIPRLNKQKRNEVMSYIELLIRKNTTPAEANLIAFRNGIYDIETDTLMDFNPSVIITNKINYDYFSDAYNEVTDKTLDKIACNDSNIRSLLEQVIGYCFYRRNELRKSFILTGEKRNGKSTFLAVIQKLLGDENTCSLDLREIGDKFKTSELHMKLANIGDDIGDEFIPNPAMFKKVVSGERINVEKKGKDPFDFNPYCKLLFSANDIPRIKDRGAVIDRLIIVPFNAKFSKSDADYDPFIKYKMLQEDSLEYLIRLGINGLKNVLENQEFTVSEKTQKALSEYEESNNPILIFFSEHDISDFEGKPTREAYQMYQEFCRINSLQELSNIEFSKQAKRYYGFEIVNKTIRGNKYRVFVKE